MVVGFRPYIRTLHIIKHMKHVLLTSPYDVKFETDIINRLFREGLDELHIRKPQFKKDQMRAYIERIDPAFHDRLVLHSFYSLIHKFGISRIHIGEEWRKNIFLRFFLSKFVLKGKKVSKSTTVHSYKSLYHTKPDIEEVMLGPVFAHTASDVYVQLIKSEKLVKAIDQAGLPILALGGVGIETADFFKDNGFSGYVLQSYIWKSIDPVRAFIDLKNFENKSARHLMVVGK